MRTRFLATDCSTKIAASASASTAAAAVSRGGSIETLDFVHLLLPDLPPPSYPSVSPNLLRSLDEISAFGVSPEFDKLPIDDALSMFLSDVLPHFVNGACFKEQRIVSEMAKPKETDLTTSCNKGIYGLSFLQFEIPEMDVPMLPLKRGISSQSKCLHYSADPEAELSMDLLNYEITLHEPVKIHQSLCSVDDISIEYSMEQKAYSLEDADTVKGKLQFYNTKFPVFEVDIESLGVIGLGRMNSIVELLSFENIDKQQEMQLDGVISYNEELLGFMDSDWIKYLFNNLVAIPGIGETNCSSQLDFISIIELSHGQKYSTLHGYQDGYLMWSMDPYLFDAFMFIDLDPYNFCGVFSDSAKKIKAEMCEYMFEEAMNFKSFDQLIVCHEITLIDGSFKSLPAPIFSDEGNTSSLHTLIKELFAKLDWQSSSASDGLYLDWNFLEGADCASANYSSWKLWEIESYNVDANMNLSDCGKLIFDFILSEDHSSKSNIETTRKL